MEAAVMVPGHSGSNRGPSIPSGRPRGGGQQWRAVDESTPVNSQDQSRAPPDGSNGGHSGGRSRSNHGPRRRSNHRLFQNHSNGHSSDSENQDRAGVDLGSNQSLASTALNILPQNMNTQEETAMYQEMHRLQDRSDHLVSSMSALDSSLSSVQSPDDSLQERLQSLIAQREQLQQAELDLRAQIIARVEVARMQSVLDGQTKRHAEVEGSLQANLRQKEEKIQGLQQLLDERQRQLAARKEEVNQAVRSKEIQVWEQTNELANLRKQQEDLLNGHKQLIAQREKDCAQIEELKEQSRKKQQDLHEVEEQNRQLQEILRVKEEEMQNLAQAWSARHQTDAYHMSQYTSTHAELRSEFNQLWNAHLQQTEHYSGVMIQMQQESDALRVQNESLRAQLSLRTTGARDSHESKVSGGSSMSNEGMMNGNASMDSLPRSAKMSTQGHRNKGLPNVPLNGVAALTPFMMNRETSGNIEQATGHPVVAAPPLLGLPGGPLNTQLHQYGLHQQGMGPAAIPALQVAQPPPMTQLGPIPMLAQQHLPLLQPQPPPRQNLHLMQQQPTLLQPQQAQHSSDRFISGNPAKEYQQAQQDEQPQILPNQPSQSPESVPSDGHERLSEEATESLSLSGQQSLPPLASASSVQGQHGQDLLAGEGQLRFSESDEALLLSRQSRPPSQQPSPLGQKSSQIQPAIQHTNGKVGEHGNGLVTDAVKTLPPPSQMGELLPLQHEKGIASDELNHLQPTDDNRPLGIHAAQSPSQQIQGSLAPGADTNKAASEVKDQGESIEYPLPGNFESQEGIKGRRLMEEAELLSCLVRVINSSNPDQSLKISVMVANRLGNLLKPYSWKNYSKQYGTLLQFIAHHPELFVVTNNDSVHLMEGARAQINAHTAGAKAAGASPMASHAPPTVAVTPASHNRGRNSRGIANGVPAASKDNKVGPSQGNASQQQSGKPSPQAGLLGSPPAQGQSSSGVRGVQQPNSTGMAGPASGSGQGGSVGDGQVVQRVSNEGDVQPALSSKVGNQASTNRTASQTSGNGGNPGNHSGAVPSSNQSNGLSRDNQHRGSRQHSRSGGGQSSQRRAEGQNQASMQRVTDHEPYGHHVTRTTSG